VDTLCAALQIFDKERRRIAILRILLPSRVPTTMGDDGDPDAGHMSDSSDSNSSSSSGEPLEEDPANKLRRHQLDAKIEFDENKKNILDSIPKAYKENFGQIGFGKWAKKWLPVLIRSPYDVGPGTVRRQWFAMYEKVSFKLRRRLLLQE
jgi:hypothetical protein